jgi:hypothetical protein
MSTWCLALSCVQVKVQVSGLWFISMLSDDRNKLYEAIAVEYVNEKSFAALGRGPSTKQEAIRFHVLEDLEDDPNQEVCKNPHALFFCFCSLRRETLSSFRPFG